MRFSTVVFFAAVAGMTAAAPAMKRDLVTEVGDAVKSFDDASGVTAAEDAVDAASNGAVSKLEETLGVTYAEKVLHLERRAAPGDIQTVGGGLKQVADGLGVTATEDFLNKESGDALYTAEDALGVDTVEKSVGYERK